MGIVRYIITFVLMFAFWIGLSGYFDAFHIISGLLSSLFVSAISTSILFQQDMNPRVEAGRIFRFVLYLPWLMKEIVLANIDLVYRTLHPAMPIDPCVITFRVDLKEDLSKTTLANSITLTPGTVTMDVTEDGVFTVHAISRSAADSLLSGEMAHRVRRIENANAEDHRRAANV